MSDTDNSVSEAQSGSANPAGIMALTTAHWGAQVLFTANRLGVFELISRGHRSAAEVARECGASVRGMALLLKACVALGLLDRDGDAFALTPAAAAVLVPGAPGYLGNGIRYSDDLYAIWSRLEHSVRADEPALATSEYTGDDAARTRHFVMAMHDRALGIGRVLVDMLDLTGRRRLLDLGGGPGTYSALLADRHPGLQCTVVDLPGVVAIAEEIVADMDAADRVNFLPGDFHRAELPPGVDTVLISGVFHRESEAGCRALIARAAAALDSGGMLVVSDVFTGAGGCEPPMAALFGLNMLLTAPDGGVHEAPAVADWLTAGGFAAVEVRPFPPPLPHQVVIGIKA